MGHMSDGKVSLQIPPMLLICVCIRVVRYFHVMHFGTKKLPGMLPKLSTIMFTLKLSHHTPQRRLSGEEIQLLLTLLPGTRRRGVVSATPWPHPSPEERDPQYPLYSRPGGSQELVWTQRPQEKSSCLCRGSNPDRLDVQSITRHYTN
jgi:hypothetical protein